MKTSYLNLWFCVVLAAVLTACGGGSDSPNPSKPVSPVPSLDPMSFAPTAAQAAAICGGMARASAAYDVYLPTSNGITPASRYVQLYGQALDPHQCISVSGATAQNDLEMLQVVTADRWSHAISFFDPVGTPVMGGSVLQQGLFVTCAANSELIRHLGILNGSTLVGSNPLVAVTKGHALFSYECLKDSVGNVSAGKGKTAVTFSSDGSVVIADGASGSTAISAAQAPSLFTPAGYRMNGNTLRWYLYQLPAQAGQKQVVVHTNQKSDGTVGLMAFVQP